MQRHDQNGKIQGNRSSFLSQLAGVNVDICNRDLLSPITCVGRAIMSENISLKIDLLEVSWFLDAIGSSVNYYVLFSEVEGKSRSPSMC